MNKSEYKMSLLKESNISENPTSFNVMLLKQNEVCDHRKQIFVLHTTAGENRVVTKVGGGRGIQV